MTTIATCGACAWMSLESPRVAVGREGPDGKVPVEERAREHHESTGHVVVIVRESGELVSLRPEPDPKHAGPVAENSGTGGK